MIIAILTVIPSIGSRARTSVDHVATTLALLGISMPTFWLGPLLAIVFSVSLGWLPVSGRGTPAHLVLPAITLGAPLAAVLARMTRASLIEELGELYVLAARARGVSRVRAVLKHAFRNSLIPIVTVLGLQFGAVLTGAVITETIFAWPGVGRLLIQSISARTIRRQGFPAVTHVSELLVDPPMAFSIRGSGMNDGVRPRRPQRTLLWIGASIVALTAVAAIAGPLLMPYDPSSQELALRLEGPSGSHLFGLDELGRDILTRVLAGARISFLVGLTVVSFSALIGTMLGAMAAYFGGVVDDLVSRIVDVLLAFPGLLLAIALVAVLGPSLGNVLFALTIIGWVGYARLVRGQVLRAREFEYVQAARALGAGAGRVVAPSHSDGASCRRRAGDARHGRSDHQRSRSQLSRAWRAAADTQLGHDAQWRAGASARCATPHAFSGIGDRAARTGLQLRRRRLERSCGSEGATLARAAGECEECRILRFFGEGLFNRDLSAGSITGAKLRVGERSEQIQIGRSRVRSQAQPDHRHPRFVQPQRQPAARYAPRAGRAYHRAGRAGHDSEEHRDHEEQRRDGEQPAGNEIPGRQREQIEIERPAENGIGRTIGAGEERR